MLLDYFVSEFQRIDPGCTADEIADVLWLASQGLFPPRVARPAEPHETGSADGTNYEKLPDGDFKKSSKETKLSEKIGTKSPVVPLLPSVPGPAEDSCSGGTVGGLPLRVPAAQALPGALELARAFRPLMRRVGSRTQVQLDEEETVRRIADERIWMPVLAAVRARWLDVALVIDTHGSMLIWQQTVRELRLLLEHQGAFRDVRTWTLNTSTPDRVVLHAGPHHADRKPRELIDPSGRRVIIIASDCLGPAWFGTAAAELLRTLGVHNPVVLWQMLPQPVWRQTALRSAQMIHVSATEMAAPNHRLRSELWRPLPDEEIARGLALPVVTVEPHRVRAWARLLSGAPLVRLPAVIMRPTLPPEEEIEEDEDEIPADSTPPSPERRILDFRKNASPPAFKLACVLAGAPLRLPIMRLVQRTMLPNSEQIHLAEVFLSGLIERVTAEDSSVDPDFVDYDFCAGIRARLLDASWLPQVLEVQTVVSDYLMRHFGQALDFQAILADPESAQPIGSGPADKRFASITTEVLRRLGGKYAEAADRLDRLGHAAEHGRTADRFGLESRETTTQLQPDRNAFEGVAILWVDDYPKNNVRERKELEDARACITPSLSTREALESLSEHRFDAIISDLGRAEGAFEGFRLLEQIRAQGSQIPFAIYAGTRALKFAREALRKGALVSTNEFDEVRNYLSHALETAQPGGLLSDAQWYRLQMELAKSSEGQVVVGILRRDPHEPAWDEIWNLVRGEGIEALAVAIIAAVAGTGYCQLWRVQERRILLVAQAVDRGLATYEEASWQGLIGRAAKSNRVVYASNVDEEIGYIPAEPSTRSEVSIPISVNGAEGAEGVINIESPKLGAFAGRQIQWLELLARSLASRWMEVTPAVRRADRSLHQRDRLKQSEAGHRGGNQINPQDADTHYNLGNLLAEQGRAEEAEEAYRQAPARPEGAAEILPTAFDELPEPFIFISYTSEDLEAATRVKEGLESSGIRVWMARKHEISDPSKNIIRRRISRCGLFLPLISRNTESTSAGFFRKEWMWADERLAEFFGSGRRFLIPVVIDGTNVVSAAIPEDFKRFHAAHLPDGQTNPEFVAEVSQILNESLAKAETQLQQAETNMGRIPWSKMDELGLARYVDPNRVKLRIGVNSVDLVHQPDGIRRIVEAIYNELLRAHIRVAPEKYFPNEQLQMIRSQEEILEQSGEATCLELALLFCAASLAEDLLPVLIVLQGHALAAVSLTHLRRDWNAYDRPEYRKFDRGQLHDVNEIIALVETKHYIAIECAGFAQSEDLSGGPTELGGRQGGVLTFNQAVAVGRAQLSKTDRPFQYALDIATLHYGLRLSP